MHTILHSQLIAAFKHDPLWIDQLTSYDSALMRVLSTPYFRKGMSQKHEGEVEYEGDRAHPVETYHGHVWRAYDMMGNLLGSFTVNAAEGYRQEFRTEL